MYMRLSDGTAQRLIGSKKPREVVRWQSKVIESVHSLTDRLTQLCRSAYSTGRESSSKIVETGKTQWQAWIRIVCLHILPVVAALVLIMLNVKGYFIGKQLEGHINQDGTKMLALQITAKIHELLMLASLADILCSYLLHLVVFGNGAPLAALTAGQNFSSISYLWSKDFYAICRATFSRKAVLLCLAIVCTILGVLVGPSSATAMAPREDVWVVNRLQLPISIKKGRLWPSTLDQTTLPGQLCLNQPHSCGTAGAWTSLSANLFSYWGSSSYGGLQGMPEAASVNGADAMRMLRVRFRGPLSLYQPDFTVATVQPISTANMVNGLRQLWFSNNAKKCGEKQGGYCDYKDIEWSINTMQPTVYVACGLVDLTEGLNFPTMSTTDGSAITSRVSTDLPTFNNTTKVAVEALPLDGDTFSKVSVGAVVRVNNGDQNDIYTCSIDAQWSRSIVATTFLGSPFMVDGSPPYFFVPLTEGSTYRGQRVRIGKSWADTVFSTIDTAMNVTVLDSLYTSGSIPATMHAGEKIESMFSVLVAESMARVISDVGPDLVNTSKAVATLRWSELHNLKATSSDGQVLSFRTTVTGYGYGIWTGESIAVGVLLSVMILIMYCLIVATHFITRIVQREAVIYSWRKVIEILVLALQSPLDPSSSVLIRDESSDLMLRQNVRFMHRGDHVEMVFGQGIEKHADDDNPPVELSRYD